MTIFAELDLFQNITMTMQEIKGHQKCLLLVVEDFVLISVYHVYTYNSDLSILKCTVNYKGLQPLGWRGSKVLRLLISKNNLIGIKSGCLNISIFILCLYTLWECRVNIMYNLTVCDELDRDSKSSHRLFIFL